MMTVKVVTYAEVFTWKNQAKRLSFLKGLPLRQRMNSASFDFSYTFIDVKFMKASNNLSNFTVA